MLRKIALGLLAVLAAMGLYVALRPGPERRLADLIADLRAQGEPVTIAEMDPPMPPDSENGAPEIDAAMAWWEKNQPAPGWESRTAGPWNRDLEAPYWEHASPEQMEALRVLLTDLAPFFERVDRAVARPTLVWSVPERREAADLLSFRLPVEKLRRLIQLIGARSRAGATPDERLVGVISRVRLETRTRTSSALDELVMSTAAWITLVDLRDLLALEQVDPRSAREALDSDLRTTWSSRLPRLVRAERASGLEQMPFVIDGSVWSAPKIPRGQRPPTEFEHLAGRIERWVEGRPPKRPQTLIGMIEMLRDLDALLEPGVTTATVGSLMDDPRLHGNSFALIVPPIAKRLLQLDMQSRAARVALAAYEHRREHGVWPASHGDLAPLFRDGVPLDPYTDAPFVFERDGDALVVRAVPPQRLLDRCEEDRARDQLGHVWRLPPR